MAAGVLRIRHATECTQVRACGGVRRERRGRRLGMALTLALCCSGWRLLTAGASTQATDYSTGSTSTSAVSATTEQSVIVLPVYWDAPDDVDAQRIAQVLNADDNFWF